MEKYHCLVGLPAVDTVWLCSYSMPSASLVELYVLGGLFSTFDPIFSISGHRDSHCHISGSCVNHLVHVCYKFLSHQSSVWVSLLCCCALCGPFSTFDGFLVVYLIVSRATYCSKRLAMPWRGPTSSWPQMGGSLCGARSDQR